MFMIGFLLFSASFLLIIHLLGFKEDKLIDWVRDQRLVRQQQQPSDQEEAKIEETDVKHAEQDITRDSPVYVTLLDPDVLECPTCCEPLKIPVFQCDNGHLSCYPCCEKVRNICPSCKLPIGYSRCRAIERVIEASSVSCPNAKYGCKENSVFGNSHSHEMQCFFTACSCPMSDCDYTGSYKDLYIHVRDKHKDDLVLFVWDTSLNVPWSLSKKIAVFQEEKDGGLIVVQVFSGSHGLTVSASCIAPLAPILGRFSCSLKLGNSSVRLKQALMLKKIQKVSDEEPQDGFMLIPSYLLSSDGNWKMRICISRGLTRVNQL